MAPNSTTYEFQYSSTSSFFKNIWCPTRITQPTKRTNKVDDFQVEQYTASGWVQPSKNMKKENSEAIEC